MSCLERNTWIDNKDAEIPIGDIENRKIDAHKEFKINSCGREGSPTGTEGEFDIYDGSDKVRHFYWNCPWGSKTNAWSITGMKYLLGARSPELLDSQVT